MTATAPESTGTQVVRIPDAGRMVEFAGYLLGEVSTQMRDQPRWLEISLYKVTDGTERYILHLCGASVVYHKHNGPCNTGVPTSVDDMPLDSEACKICRPGPLPEYFSPSERLLWDLEQDRYTVYQCKTAEDVVNRLRKPRNRKNEDGGTLSAPAQRLLDMVSPRDKDIAKIVRVVERI